MPGGMPGGPPAPGLRGLAIRAARSFSSGSSVLAATTKVHGARALLGLQPFVEFCQRVGELLVEALLVGGLLALFGLALARRLAADRDRQVIVVAVRLLRDLHRVDEIVVGVGDQNARLVERFRLDVDRHVGERKVGQRIDRTDRRARIEFAAAVGKFPLAVFLGA